jgi:type III restriction enzyme
MADVVIENPILNTPPRETLDSMPEIVRFVKNQNLGFTIPFTGDGQQRNYIPDFIVVLRDREDPEDLLHLIIEVTGEKKRDKESKVQTAQTLWVPAVNNHGGLGRWSFLEIRDAWDVKRPILQLLSNEGAERSAESTAGFGEQQGLVLRSKV